LRDFGEELNMPLTSSAARIPDASGLGAALIRRFPSAVRPYLELIRLDRLWIVWLAILPTWWGISLGGPPLPRWQLMLAVAASCVALRGAGAAVNDIVDRDFDRQIERTARRPVASGRLSVASALAFAGAMAAVGLLLLLPLGRAALALATVSLVPLGLYPFMKRVTHWPQLWLGLTFNWGVLVGWVAVHGRLSATAVVLYLAAATWTLGYDTIYALQDRADDVRIGVKSTAVLLGTRIRLWVGLFYATALGLLSVAGLLAHLHPIYYVLLLPAAANLGWQVVTLRPDDPADPMRKFRANRYLGWLVLLALVAGRF
jgi:4-hydroxybenzoate polyprenyltransferase